MTAPYVCMVKDEAETHALGRKLAKGLELGMIIYLLGDLGAGKTTLARALIQAHAPDARVKSPTYTLVERYVLPEFKLHHLDLYRINDPDEIEFLGVRDIAGEDVLLIEWPERGVRAIPPPDLSMLLEHHPQGRRVTIRAESIMGERFLERVTAAKH